VTSIDDLEDVFTRDASPDPGTGHLGGIERILRQEFAHDRGEHQRVSITIAS